MVTIAHVVVANRIGKKHEVSFVAAIVVMSAL
jgi:hypothetical protein